MLEVLVAADGGVISAEELLARAWDENADPFTNAVRITVSTLRKRLGEPWLIATVPGVGYRIDTGALMPRRPGMSVRLKLTISYTAFIMLAGALLLVALWVFANYPSVGAYLGLTPNRYAILRALCARLGCGSGARPCARLRISRRLDPGRPHVAAVDSESRPRRVRAASGSLSHRIEMDGPNDEFHELADAFDGMIAKLEAQVSEQQRFAANASHELRTPLAVTQTLLDVALKDPTRDDIELLERLRTVNTRAIDLTEALLVLSRVDQRSFTKEDVDLSLVAEEATESLLPLAEKHGVTVETSGDVAHASGSHALLLQMTTNLVHNAIVHNLPEHGTVRVTTANVARAVTLTVENTGEQIDLRLVATLTEPFQRGTERIRTDHAGVGLGLAIVKRIAHAHDGTLALAPRPAGGLCVTVRLPVAAPYAVS